MPEEQQAQTIQVQVNCPHLSHMIMNGQQMAMCQLLRADISKTIGDHCVGDKCPLKKVEVKK